MHCCKVVIAYGAQMDAPNYADVYHSMRRGPVATTLLVNIPVTHVDTAALLSTVGEPSSHSRP
jgi:hypothetical protein